jgi:hypothetical protein
MVVILTTTEMSVIKTNSKPCYRLFYLGNRLLIQLPCSLVLHTQRTSKTQVIGLKRHERRHVV